MPMVLRDWSKRFASEGIASGRRKRTQTLGSASTQPALERGLIEFGLPHEGTVSDLRAAIRSSIRSRSTSQYLSDERRRLCVDSNWVEASSCGIAHRIALLCLLAPRLDFDVLERVRLSRPALINDSPFS